ncbi:MAG: PaaI family thioesterase [Crocinitomicaceae bacterium]|nr:PaaI family thioesterase [Crocinitomicaceae bacterium]
MNNLNIVELYKMSNEFGRTIDFEYDILPNGDVVNRITIDKKHLATPVAAHGGVLAALADSTLGVAALAESQKEGNLVSTVEFKINYLKPAFLGDVISGVSRVRKVGKKLIFVEADFVNQKDELIATASGTFNQYPFTKVFNL